MKTTRFLAFCVLCAGLLVVACQKDELAKPFSNDTVGPRANAQPTITFSSNPAIAGQVVSVYLEFGTCGTGQLQEEVPVGSGIWIQRVGSTSAGAGVPDITYSFTPTSIGTCAYNFRANVSGGSGCTAYTGSQPGVCLDVIADVACYTAETAWGDGSRYVNPGNWATYTAYSGTESTVTLYAGQTYNAGTVHFSAVSGENVDITVTLNSGFVFADDPENVKIQGYDSAPSGNPSPGGFANKSEATSSPYTVTVAAANYFGVHVDVMREITCPE